MLKIMGAILLIISSGAVGFIASAKLKTKVEFYHQMLSLITEFKTHIRYLGTTLEMLIKRKDNTLLTPMLTKCRTNLKSGLSFKESFALSINEIPKNCNLKEDENNLILDFGKGLGVTDVEGQLLHLNLYFDLFIEKLEQAKIEQTQKSKLYKTFGLSCGVLLALLII